ncbi:MAG: LysR family transcriptional regulator [Marinomonas foliarum]|jgi:DNA-binding transcriptional LysR family regulator|uniref:DNA-binding transcriptional LysR family regulator n=1 Tax=Marinomonas foliarum TaxID=491950 RepID=A0A368ZQE6_9GAMM|nr:LysR family transcriptional regulator [Marinomonas foliarum]QRV22733.1 LysR family transcriptional regulator [Marinomonas foliarum]RCW97933.1 DNA-binding transcriptional LysR family regulator [Marinomonas foliarum]
MNDISLKYFHAVAKTGSLSAASEEMHVAVSAISRQIAQLEEKLQLTLFERKARGMALTPAGDILYTYALRNTLEFKNVMSEMKGISNIQQQSIALACPEGMAWDFLPHIITQFRLEYPSARFSLQVVDSSRATQLVRDGSVDAAFTFNLQPEQGVEVSLQVPSPVVALLSKKHPLASQQEISIRDLTEYPIATSEPGTTLSYLFEIACHIEGVQVIPALSSSSVGAIYTFVCESDNAIALCGELTVARRAQNDGLVILPIRDPSLAQRSLQVQIMSRRKLPVIVRYFLSHLTESLKKQG